MGKQPYVELRAEHVVRHVFIVYLGVLVKGSLVKCYVVCLRLGVRGLLLLSLWFSMKCLAFENDSLMHLSPYMIQKELNLFLFLFFLGLISEMLLLEFWMPTLWSCFYI